MNIIKRQKNSKEDKIFNIIVNTMVVLAAIITIYPIYFVVLASISDPTALNSGKVFLWPVLPDLGAYIYILKNNLIWIGYSNTILYTVSGTALGAFITVLGGYALSRKDLVGRDLIMKIMVFTMFFSGGLIPTYMVIKNLGLVNTRSVMIILGSFSVFNLIITRTFFISKIPDELYEAAQMDGCGNARFFFSIVLPLSKEIVSVVVLYIAVTHWNSFFNALIYLSNTKLYPLQLILRDILVGAGSLMTDSVAASDRIEMQRLSETIKYGVMVVSTLPILALYPFLQKYFIGGVMIGSIKG